MPVCAVRVRRHIGVGLWLFILFSKILLLQICQHCIYRLLCTVTAVVLCVGETQRFFRLRRSVRDICYLKLIKSLSWKVRSRHLLNAGQVLALHFLFLSHFVQGPLMRSTAAEHFPLATDPCLIFFQRPGDWTSLLLPEQAPLWSETCCWFYSFLTA